MDRLYKGFSFSNFEKSKSFKLYDVELVKRDIYNHLFTRKNSRLKMANYGTRIPDLPFDQLDEQTIRIFRTDFTEVLNYDPRVSIRSLEVIPLFDENALVGIADLNYIYLNLTDRLHIRLDFST